MYNPESSIYQLSSTGSAILLIALALGVFIGIWGKGLFNYPSQVAPDQVIRHRKAHALFHWINAIGFVLCLIATVIIFKWVKTPEGTFAYQLHFVGAALVSIALVAVSIRALVYEPRKHGIKITGEDLKELRYELLCYFGLAGKYRFLGFGTRTNPKRANPPHQSEPQKYLATERVLSYPVWVILSGLILFSGIIKALRYVTGMPDSVLSIATLVHDYAAIASVVMLFVHAGAVILIKTNWPLLRSMFTLTTPMSYGKEEVPWPKSGSTQGQQRNFPS